MYKKEELKTQPYTIREWVGMAKELNKRKTKIRTEEIVRHGQETIPRRSSFLEW